MTYYDKHGNEILDGATVIFHGNEYTARDHPDGVRMVLQPGPDAPSDLRPIPMELIQCDHLELLIPTEADFADEE